VALLGRKLDRISARRVKLPVWQVAMGSVEQTVSRPSGSCEQSRRKKATGWQIAGRLLLSMTSWVSCSPTS